MINQKKKKNNNNILLNLLFKSKNIYGESLKDTNKSVLPFIYGVRHDYTIINLKNISFFLKRIFKLIKNILNNNEKILIIGNSNDINFLINLKYIKNNKNIIFFNQEWVNGLITNKIINNSLNKKINLLFKKEKIKLILIIKSSINDNFLNKELSVLKIPTISILNTNQDIKNVDYPIISNTKNIKSIYTLMYLLRNLF
uniref:ribosomal protein S2 n=1 Tax=Phytopythium vexans TaxID=907947 RepID=UPI0020283729|nr:ribosomal protein S2 [Phytopythium vexans]YP_010395070.1 ribosomal protein S2 [Phytopythium vexans]DAZ89459.1 TPA_asm: ribosomal protein S2 [Phytopythium vexans]DAZ89507.1 TPA_asm: ribosomal protein S2 [Phytopythium vexans]